MTYESAFINSTAEVIIDVVSKARKDRTIKYKKKYGYALVHGADKFRKYHCSYIIENVFRDW